MVAQPGDFSAARRARENIENGCLGHRGQARRWRGLLRAQRRRRCGARRGAARARRQRPAAAIAVDARGRIRLGTVRAGDGGHAGRLIGRRRWRGQLARADLGQPPSDAARAPSESRPARGVARRPHADTAAGDRHADRDGRRQPAQRRAVLRFSEPARGQSRGQADAASRVDAARAWRASQCVRDRIVHGRTRRRFRH